MTTVYFELFLVQYIVIQSKSLFEATVCILYIHVNNHDKQISASINV